MSKSNSAASVLLASTRSSIPGMQFNASSRDSHPLVERTPYSFDSHLIETPSPIPTVDAPSMTEESLPYLPPRAFFVRKTGIDTSTQVSADQSHSLGTHGDGRLTIQMVCLILRWRWSHSWESWRSRPSKRRSSSCIWKMRWRPSRGERYVTTREAVMRHNVERDQIAAGER
jgi:hypothetical protein